MPTTQIPRHKMAVLAVMFLQVWNTYIYIFSRNQTVDQVKNWWVYFLFNTCPWGSSLMGFLGLGSISLTQNMVSNWLVLLPRKLILVSMTVMIRLPQHPSHKKVDQGCCCCSFPSWTLWHYGGQMVYIYIHTHYHVYLQLYFDKCILWGERIACVAVLNALLPHLMGCYMQSWENVSPFLEGACCYAMSLSWPKIVPTQLNYAVCNYMTTF